MSVFRVDGVALGTHEQALQRCGWQAREEARLLERGASKVYLDNQRRARLICGQVLNRGDEVALICGQQLSRARTELFEALGLPPCHDPAWLCSWERPRTLFFAEWELQATCEGGKFHSVSLGLSGGCRPEHVQSCQLEWPRCDSRYQRVHLTGNGAEAPRWTVGSAWVGAPAGVLGALGWAARRRHPDGTLTFRGADGRFSAAVRDGVVQRVSGPVLCLDDREVLRQGRPVGPDWSELFADLGLPYPEPDRIRFSSDPPGLVHFLDWKLSVFMSSEICGIVLEDGGAPPGLSERVRGYAVSTSGSHYRHLKFVLD